MSRLRLLMVATMLSAGSALFAGTLHTEIKMSLLSYALASDGHAYVSDSSVAFALKGSHRITSSTYKIVKEYPVDVLYEYRNTIVASGDPGVCYRGYLDITASASATGETLTQAAGTARYCLPSSGGGGTTTNNCYTDPETGQTTCSGGGSGTYNTQDCGYNNVELGGCASPIVINSRSGEYRLSGGDDLVQFDLNANGTPDYVTWTARQSDIAFLALDRNGNGRIDDGSELFGNHTPLGDGSVAASGFDALASLDSNGDGVIDSTDSVWQRLLLWTDSNHDGISSSDELRPIAWSDISAIELGYKVEGRRDQYGNLFRFKGAVRVGSARRAIYDVFFRIKE